MNNDAYFTVGMENTYPLMRIDGNTEQTIAPKLFSKYTSFSMTNSSDQQKILSYNDIYAMDRMNSTTNPETGVSLGYGTEYNIIKKNLENTVYLDGKISIGQVIKGKKIKEMPKNSSLQEKKSDFVGNAYFNLSNPNSTDLNGNIVKTAPDYYNLNLDYTYIINNNLNKFLQNNLKASFENQNNVFSSEYTEEHEIADKHSVTSQYQRKFENDLNFIIGATHDIQEGFLERSNIELNYESDCLKIGFNLSKKFYQSEDVRPQKNLTFSITLKPFGSPVAPDMSSFLDNY